MDTAQQVNILPASPQPPQPEANVVVQPNGGSNYGWIKSIFFIILLVAIVDTGIYLLIRSSNTEPPPPPSSTTTPNPTTVVVSQEPSPTSDPTITWETHTNQEGQFSLMYPNTYSIYTVIKEMNGGSDTIQLVSPVIDSLNINYSLTVSYRPAAGNQTLASLIDQNPVCPIISSQTGTPSSLNSKTEARLYEDVPCGQRTNTIIYTKQNNMLYIMRIDASGPFSNIKPYTDQILTTLKFFNPNMQPSSDQGILRPQILCIQEARQCPDGSWKGRTGQKCDNTCPKD